MKAQIIAIITGAIAASVFAGGLNTNTNQSIAYQRHVMRYATTDNDAPIFNPAGTAFMEDGWHVSLNSQAFWQTRTIYTESPLFDEEKKFEGKAQIPAMPSLLATWHRGDLAISGYFGIVGGGGKLDYKKGIPSFEAAVAQIPGLLTKNGLTTTDYSADLSLKGTSYIFGFGLGAAYRINEMFSAYLGAKFSYAINHYEGKLQNVQVNPKNAQLGLDGEMVKAAATFNQLSETLAGYAEQAAEGAQKAAAAAQQYEAAGDKATAAQYAAKANELKEAAKEYTIKSKTFEAVAEQVSDKELDVEQTGWGITPLASISFKYKDLTAGVKFEYNTSIEMKNSTKVNEVGLAAYDDGVKSHSDIPASIYMGLTYALFDNFRVSAGYGHWFDWYADLPGDQEKHAEGTDEFLGGVEADILTRLTVSGGFQISQYHLDDEYMSDMSFIMDNVTLGCGLAFRATDWIKINVAYFHSIYDDWKEKEAYGSNTYKRTSRGVGIGADLDF